jgi:hypothetical protein
MADYVVPLVTLGAGGLSARRAENQHDFAVLFDFRTRNFLSRFLRRPESAGHVSFFECARSMSHGLRRYSLLQRYRISGIPNPGHRDNIVTADSLLGSSELLLVPA